MNQKTNRMTLRIHACRFGTILSLGLLLEGAQASLLTSVKDPGFGFTKFYEHTVPRIIGRVEGGDIPFSTFFVSVEDDYRLFRNNQGHKGVFKCHTHESDSIMAVKYYCGNDDDREKTIAEQARIFDCLKPNGKLHRNIVPTYFVKHTSKRPESEFLIFSDFCHGGDLAKNIEVISNNAKLQKAIIQAIYNVMVHCYNNKVAHRDLKPENVFLRRPVAEMAEMKFDNMVNNVLVGDWDTAVTWKDAKRTDKVMTSGCTYKYRAPEAWGLREQNYTTRLPVNEHLHALDMWSFGVTIYKVVMGKDMLAHKIFADPPKPPTGLSRIKLMKWLMPQAVFQRKLTKLVDGKFKGYKIAINDIGDIKVKHVVGRLLETDPKRRACAQQMSMGIRLLCKVIEETPGATRGE